MSGTDLRVTLRYDGSELDSGLRASGAQLQQWSQYFCVPAAEGMARVGNASHFSGQKMAQFGLVTASVSGALGNLPIKGEAVGKVFGVVGELAAGAVNPLYLLAAAIGAVGTAYALVTKKREEDNKKLTEANDLLREHVDLLMRQAALEGEPGAYTRIFGDVVGKTDKDIKEGEERLKSLIERLNSGGQMVDVKSYGEGGVSIESIFAPDSELQIKEVEAEIVKLTDELRKAYLEMAKMKGFGPETVQGPENEDPASYYRRIAEEAQRQREEADRLALVRKQSKFLYGDGWKAVPADLRARPRYALGGEGGPMEIPDFLRDSIGKTSEDVRKRDEAEAEKTRAIYEKQIQALRGTLDAMFGAAWQNAGQGFDKMVQEMAKAAAKHLGWFFLQKGLDAAVPGIGSALGWSPLGGSKGSGSSAVGDAFGAGATAGANLQRRSARMGMA